MPFLQRVSIADGYAQRCTGYSKFARVSVCLSHAAGIVSKWLMLQQKDSWRRKTYVGIIILIFIRQMSNDSKIKTVKTRNKNKQANKTLTQFT